MRSFVSRWDEPPKGIVSKRIKNRMKFEGPIKPRLEQASQYIRLHIANLENLSRRLAERDGMLFRRVVSAMRSKDLNRAAIYANEVAETRRVNITVTQCKLAFEQIEMRITTLTEVGDVALTLAMAKEVVNNVNSTLTSVLPAAQESLGEVSGMLSDVLLNSTQTTGQTPSFDTISDEAEKILSEAFSLAERDIKERFPEVPASVQQKATQLLSEPYA